MTHPPVSVDAKLDFTTLSTIKVLWPQEDSAASHALLSSARPVPPKTSPDVLHALLVPLWIQITLATVYQDTMKLMELVKLVPQSAMVAKSQVSVQPVLILKED
jgi:hypothetical protein